MLLECRVLHRDPRPALTVNGGILLNATDSPRFLGGSLALFQDWRCQGLPFNSIIYENTDSILFIPHSSIIRTVQHEESKNIIYERYYSYIKEENSFHLIKVRTRHSSVVTTAVNLLSISHLRSLGGMSRVTDPLLKLFFDAGTHVLSPMTMSDLSIELFRHTMFTTPLFTERTVLFDIKQLITKLLGFNTLYANNPDGWYQAYMNEFHRLPCVNTTKQTDPWSIAQGEETTISPQDVRFTTVPSLLNISPCQSLIAQSSQTITLYNHKLFADIVQEAELLPLTDFCLQGVMRSQDLAIVKPYRIKYAYNRYSMFDGSSQYLETMQMPDFLSKIAYVFMTYRVSDPLPPGEDIYFSITKSHDDEILITCTSTTGLYSESYYYDLLSMSINSFSVCDASEYEIDPGRLTWT